MLIHFASCPLGQRKTDESRLKQAETTKSVHLSEKPWLKVLYTAGWQNKCLKIDLLSSVSII